LQQSVTSTRNPDDVGMEALMVAEVGATFDQLLA